MRSVLVSFEVSVTQSSKGLFKTSKPDYVFQGEFNKDDDGSLSKLCDLEYRVQYLVKSLVDLGCKVIALRKETSHLEF